MRNFFTRKGKPKILLDLSILTNKYNIRRRHLIVSLFFLSIFFINAKLSIFALLTLFSAVFTYLHSVKNKSVLDLKFSLFLGLFITHEYGIGFTFIFFLASDVIPGLLGGQQLEAASIFFIAWYFIVNFLVLLFPDATFIYLGIALVIVESIGSAFISVYLRGLPIAVAVSSPILSMLVRVGYFFTLGPLLIILFDFF